MAINRILEREHEIAVQEEVTYGTDPGAVVAGDFFKAQLAPDAVQRAIARADRDQDRDYAQASVLSTQKGRESATITIPGDVIPSGNGTTPTEPDMDLLFKAVFGSKHKATAHTTTAAGSAGVSLNLTAGGVVASGLAVGDIFAVDVSATVGYEARQVAALPGGDVVTLDRAFTTDPAAGRTVKVGTTYLLLNSALISVYVKRFLAGTIVRFALPGVVLPDMEISVDTAQDTPIAKVSFSGRGKAEIVHTDARPTPTTAGQPLAPEKTLVWFDSGAAPKKFCIAGQASLHVNNGIELRENEGCSLQPTGPKRTGNSSRYMVEATLQLLATTGDQDTIAIYNAIQAFVYQDVLVQLGTTPGSIVAWRCARFLPEPGLTSRDGELGLNIGGGRCYGVAGDDEVRLAFI